MKRRKRTISFAVLLLLMMCFILCSCAITDQTETTGTESEIVELTDNGELDTADPAETETRSLQKTVDDFGDVTEDSKTIIASEFEGTFSNTATNGSELKGAISFQKKTDSEHYISNPELFTATQSCTEI